MNLDLVTRQTLNQVSSLQKQYIRDLSDLLESGNTLTPKTVETKIKRAKERLKEYEKEMKSVFKEATKEVWNGTLTDTFKEMKVRPNLDAVSGRQLATLETAGLQFMHNYEDSMIQQVKTQLYVSLLNGESATDAYKRIQPLGNANARPKVMIRDQLSRTYQQAIIESYGATGHPQDFEYYWTGPDDERTTEICEERKAGNPYSWEQVKELDSHPHIQCRHRWRAVLKVVAEEPDFKVDRKWAYDYGDEKALEMRDALNPYLNDYMNYDELSEEKMAVLEGYTGQLYTPINNHLRFGEELPSPLKEQVLNAIDTLTKTLDEHQTPFNMVNVRSSDIKEVMEALNVHNINDLSDKWTSEKVKKLLVGMDYTDKGFVSTSISHEYLDDYTGIHQIIKIPKGTKGMYVEEISTFTGMGEYEYILNRDTKFIIEDAEIVKVKLGKVLRLTIRVVGGR